MLAPPHTRGWTEILQFLVGEQWGSPAHAGMDLLSITRRWAEAGLPRTRGDGPPSGGAFTMLTGAPPHTRGWISDARFALFNIKRDIALPTPLRRLLHPVTQFPA